MFNNKSFSISQKQSGIALPLTLILLFAMTLLGIATLRTTTIEENMSANSRLRQVAFNAAETALRDAELSVLSLSNLRRREIFFRSGNTNFVAPSPLRTSNSESCEGGDNGGFCIPTQFNSEDNPSTSRLERWEDDALDVFNPATNRSIEFSDFANSNLDENGVIEAPRYIVEFLGNFDYKQTNVNPTGDPTAVPDLVRPEFDGVYVGACRDDDNQLIPPNNEWPYCASDPAVYRITVRATAGPIARRANVTIQSILRATGE